VYKRLGSFNGVFSLVIAVLLRSLPFPNPEQLMIVTTRDSRGRGMGVSVADFDDWQRGARTFSHLAFIFSGSFNVSDEGRVPEQYPGAYVSSSFFKMIGQGPQLGRDFSPSDDAAGATPVAMLGSSVWKLRYGSDPSVLGRVLRLNGVTATIVGVMPEGLKFPNQEDIWMPASQLSPAVLQGPREARGYYAIGRLADGVTLEQARSELKTIGDTLAREYPATNKDLAPWAEPLQENVVGSQIRLMFWSLMGAVAFVLLIACSNVANLLLARAARRSNEMSVRVALGASRWRVVRQLLIESVMLAFTAGALGLALSAAGIRWFDAETQNVGKPYWMVFNMEWRTFAFFLAVCIGTGIVFGLAPALHVSKTNVSETLKEGGRTGSGGRRARRWTTGLIVAELALTLVLLAGAGFMMRSFLTMYRMDIGIDTSRLLTMQMILPARKYPSLEDRAAFLRQVDEHLATVPDVEAAASASAAPFSGGAGRQIEVDGERAADGETRPTVTLLSVGTRYFETIGASLAQGRAFTDADGQPGREHAVVNQRLVEMYFGGQNPINRQIRLTDGTPATAQAGWLTIVGVVANVRQRNNNQESEPDPIAYIPHVQNVTMARGALLLARARSDTARAAQSVREAVRAVDPDMALFNIRTMDEVLAQQRWFLRVFTTMFGAFALVALVLAAVGLYAVTSYSVTQYTREIGVRMVLGAQPVEVVWLFLRRAFVQLAIGLSLGLAAAFAVGRLLQSFLVQTSPRDPLTLVSIVLLLTVVAVAACLWPARRATRLDPLIALRHD
jgi:putative ABC transport system permease protein